MPRFPDSSSWPIDQILFEPEDALPAVPTPEQWIDVLQAELLPRTDEPGVLCGNSAERHGWGGFGSANQIVRLDGLLFLTRRSFVRRVPPGTLREYIEKRVDAWCHDSSVTLCPKRVRAEIKKQVSEELIRRAIPSIRDVAVIIDTENHRAYVLARSSSGKRSGIFSALRLAAVAVYKQLNAKMSCERRTLGERLLEQFGTQRLPGALDQDFMRDLIGHGRDARLLVIGEKAANGVPWSIGKVSQVPNLEARIANGEVAVMRVELGGRIQASSGTDVVTARGGHETERMADMRVLGDDDSEEDSSLKMNVRSVQVIVRDMYGKWNFVLAPDATITSCEQPKVVSEFSDDVLGSMWLRAQLTKRATEIVDQLVHAYVVTRLCSLIEADPQRPLFLTPSLKPLPCVWCENIPSEALMKLWERSVPHFDSPQTEMFVTAPKADSAIESVTITGRGGSVTVTRDDAAKALTSLMFGGDAPGSGDTLSSDVEEEVLEVDDSADDDGDADTTPPAAEAREGAKPAKPTKKDAAARAKAARDRLVGSGHDPVIAGAVVADEMKRGRFDGEPSKKGQPKGADAESQYDRA